MIAKESWPIRLLSRASLRAYVALVVGACVLIFAGCTRSQAQLRICTATDLSPEQLKTVQDLTAEESVNAKKRAEIIAQQMQRQLQLSYDYAWVPLVYMRGRECTVFSGPSREAEVTDDAVQKTDRQWVYAYDRMTIGPLAIPFYCRSQSAFEMDGRNFYYNRSLGLVWGILWRDDREKKLRGDPLEQHSAGLLLTGFGYRTKRTEEGSRVYVRFFWFSIPVWKD